MQRWWDEAGISRRVHLPAWMGGRRQQQQPQEFLECVSRRWQPSAASHEMPPLLRRPSLPTLWQEASRVVGASSLAHDPPSACGGTPCVSASPSLPTRPWAASSAGCVRNSASHGGVPFVPRRSLPTIHHQESLRGFAASPRSPPPSLSLGATLVMPLVSRATLLPRHHFDSAMDDLDECCEEHQRARSALRGLHPFSRRPWSARPWTAVGGPRVLTALCKISRDYFYFFYLK